MVGALASLLAGCALAGADPAGEPGTTSPTREPRAETVSSAPLVVVEDVGGFVAPGVLFNRLPRAYVTADARLITPGPMILIYPGPALPNLRERALDPVALGALRALAAQAQLDQPPPDYGTPPVADATTTVVTYRAEDGRTFVHQAYALDIGRGPDGGDDGLTEAQRDARARLQHFVDSVADPAALGPGVGSDLRYVPQAFVVRAAPVDDAEGAEQPGTGTGTGNPAVPAPTVQAWPVESVRLAQSGTCTPVTGPDAATLHTALSQANQLTRWSQDGQVYAVSVRVSLPGEGLCR
jgi:hypothetical protein